MHEIYIHCWDKLIHNIDIEIITMHILGGHKDKSVTHSGDCEARPPNMCCSENAHILVSIPLWNFYLWSDMAQKVLLRIKS